MIESNDKSVTAQKDIDAIKEDLVVLKDDFLTISNTMKHAALSEADRELQRLKNYIVEKPLQSIGWAFVAGILAHSLLQD